ncbi:MAG TPA: O-antigen ligase family protein [Lacibacter sp.]|nr:O-antigen ligase family protein [Lacibacter sp.]
MYLFSGNKYRQFIKGERAEYPVLWWMAAGISATMIWLPILNAMMCIAFVLFWVYESRLRFRFHHKPLLFLSISFYVLTAVSFFYSKNQPEALRILQLKLPLLLFPLVFASGIEWSKKQIRLLLLFFSGSVAVFCLLTICNAALQALSARSVQALFGYTIIPLKYVYASVASLFCVFGVVIHLQELSYTRKFLSLHLLLIALFFTTVFMLSNRMGIFLSCSIVLFYLLKAVRSVWVKWLSVGVFVLVLISLYVWNQTFRNKMVAFTQMNSSQLIKLDEDASLGRTWDGLQLRLAIWQCAAGLIQKHFWTGVGVGDVQDSLQQTYEERKFYFASRFNTYNAHNQFMEQWLMTGVAGSSLLALSLLIPLIQSIRSRRTLYSIFLVVFCLFCITESFLEISKGAVWFSFFNSIFAFQQHVDR